MAVKTIAQLKAFKDANLNQNGINSNTGANHNTFLEDLLDSILDRSLLPSIPFRLPAIITIKQFVIVGYVASGFVVTGDASGLLPFLKKFDGEQGTNNNGEFIVNNATFSGGETTIQVDGSVNNSVVDGIINVFATVTHTFGAQSFAKVFINDELVGIGVKVENNKIHIYSNVPIISAPTLIFA